MLPYFFYKIPTQNKYHLLIISLPFTSKLTAKSADIAKKFAPIIERGRTNSSVDNLDR